MTWEVREENQTTNFATLIDVKPNVNRNAMEQYTDQYEQHNHKWDIRDRILPQIPVGEHDIYDPWPNGSCRHAYDGRRSADASHHASGWAMRNTNNHNAAILKKSCLGLLVCSRRCSDVTRKHPGGAADELMAVTLRPAICDKARRKQIGASCPTPGCSGTLELRRCHGHAGYPVTHFWRTQGDTIFFQAKGFHDHPIPSSWKTPASGSSDKKPTKKTRKRRKITSSDVTDSQTSALSMRKRVKMESDGINSPNVLPDVKQFDNYVNLSASHFNTMTSLPDWQQLNSHWASGSNSCAAIVNVNRQVLDANSSSWQRSSWQRIPDADSLSPPVDNAISYGAVSFQCVAPLAMNNCYSNDESEDTGYYGHGAGCRRRLFQMKPSDKTITSFCDVTAITMRPMCEPQMFPSPPPSSITTTDSFSASPPETHFDDDDFLQHLRACADNDDKHTVQSVDRSSYALLSNVDSYQCRMMSGYFNRQQCADSSMMTGNTTTHRRRSDNGDDIDDVLSIMADIVMGGTLDL